MLYYYLSVFRYLNKVSVFFFCAKYLNKKIIIINCPDNLNYYTTRRGCFPKKFSGNLQKNFLFKKSIVTAYGVFDK